MSTFLNELDKFSKNARVKFLDKCLQYVSSWWYRHWANVNAVIMVPFSLALVMVLFT